MMFERDLEDNVFALRDDLVSGRYRHGRYETFTVHDPKQRTIHKATVRDRLVHQTVVNVLEPLFEPRFIYDSYSCRVGKGVHAAVRRLRSFLRSASKNGTRTVYALKCDIGKFFASVDHGILLALVSRRVPDERAMALVQEIVGSHETAPGKGVPLGNLTSQLFANVYLHELDRFMKQKAGIRHYLRYCDDFVTLVGSRETAFSLVETIDAFLQDDLRLALHPDKTHVRTWTQGVDFLGHVLFPHATVLRPGTARRALSRVTDMNVDSYLGLCVHADAYGIRSILLHKTWRR